jgi:hypothetical protein
MIKLRTVILTGSVLLLFSSCAGWTSGQENAFKKQCEENGTMDCDCALERTKKKYPNASDFNAKAASDMDLAKELINCAKES